jgi:predicted nucleic acid-binding protein
MANRYFDTSAGAKHYSNELGSARVDAMLAEAGSRHFMSSLSVVELHSLFARRTRVGLITVAEFHQARGRFFADVVAGLWQIIPVTQAHLFQAEQLIVQHGLVRGLRSLDAIQLAMALRNAIGPLDAFVCADANLCSVAAIESLFVVNPETP